MNGWMRKGLILAVATVTVAAAHAGKTFELNEEGLKLNVGADVRLRLTKIDNYVLPASGATIDLNGWGDLEYLRLRTRVWAGLEFSEDLSLHARLVNRSQHYSTRHDNPDNNYDDQGGTWAFWDETVLDNLYLNVKAPFGATAWALRVGRQDIVLGNGMVFLEGTPYDQGRSIYFDGARADYSCGGRKVTLLALHNEFKDDRGTILGDEERRLRRGETGILGAYWTETIRDNLGTDLYGFYADIDDDQPATPEPNHPVDENAILKIVGGRVFGKANDDTDYSLEVARQFGTYNGAGAKQDLEGWMVDARLGLRQLAEKQFAPVFGLEYTYMSGAENDGDDDYEGWHPAFAEYPIWREELTALKTFGNWTNLHKARVTANLTLNPKTSMMVAGSTMYADENDPGILTDPGHAPEGDHIGETLSAFLDYRLNPAWTFSLEASQLYPGDHLPDTKTTEWMRFQAVYRF